MENTQINQTGTIACPECDTPINIPTSASIGKVVECPACGTESEITSLTPLQLAPLEEEK